MRKCVIVAMGSNAAGPWGTPEQTIKHAMSLMPEKGIKNIRISHLFKSAPLGSGFQEPYVNGVARLETTMPPKNLLSYFKTLEKKSGRRGGRPWGPRTLDLDIIDYKGLIRNWDKAAGRPKKCRRGDLILPHAHSHNRAFVLEPLMDLVPNWRHPVFLQNPSALLRRLDHGGQGRILGPLDT